MQIDNGNLTAKLKLRRHFMRKYHADGSARVFDCCQGDGVIWRELRRDFAVKSYWGVDQKPKAGRLMVDSMRVLELGINETVIDIDTYGSPWKHWAALLPNLKRDTTVFLTIGQWQMGTDLEILAAMGLGKLKIPPGIAVKLHGLAMDFLLAKAADQAGTRITEVLEAVSERNTARYVGARISVSN
jgi:hypothetical protein